MFGCFMVMDSALLVALAAVIFQGVNSVVTWRASRTGAAEARPARRRVVKSMLRSRDCDDSPCLCVV